MANSWLRLYAEFATDTKVQMMSEAMQRRLVMLFCLQCSNSIETLHETERDAAIGFALRISPEEVAATKAEFKRRRFINDDWSIRKWDDRQFASDSSTERVRKHREAKKNAELEDGNGAERFSNAPEQNRAEQNRDISNPDGLDVAANAGDLPSGDTDESKGAKDAAQPASRCPLSQIVALYHELLPMCRAVEKLTDARAGYIRQRWREDLPTLEAWRNYFTDVSRSPFLTGRAPGRDGKPPFRADLEWLTRPGNFAKVAEGRYHQ